jgi:hypothetical protein
VIDVLVRQRDVLKDRQEPLFARHALHGVVECMKPDERVQRPAMMAGWQVRGTSDRECRRGQELLDRQAIAQLTQGGFEDPAWVGLLDELHHRLDVIGKPYGRMHGLSSRSISRAWRLNRTA